MDLSRLLNQESPEPGRVSRFVPADTADEAQPAQTNRDIHMNLPARAENVALVRAVLSGIGVSLNLSAEQVEDIKLAVTEACTNVVRHAYRELGGGRIEVAAAPGPEWLTVSVADSGCGMRPDPGGDGPGLGLPLIAALSDGLEIEHDPGRGSCLTMSFRAPAEGLPSR